MTTTAMRQPRVANSGHAPARTFALTDITVDAKPTPKRYGLHAKPGWGKTSFAAQAPKPVFLQTKGETGLETLIESRQLPPTAHLPEILNWGDLLSAVKFLRTEPHEFKTLVIDTMPGAERLCYEFVCE